MRQYRCTEIIRQYRFTVFIYFDWLMELKPTMHMIGRDWLMGGHKMCDRLTELQLAVNA